MFLGFALITSGIIAYLLSAYLTHYYIRNKLMASNHSGTLYRKLSDSEYLWEKTAGLGIVPKWVSYIGLTAIAFAVIGILALLRHFFTST